MAAIKVVDWPHQSFFYVVLVQRTFVNAVDVAYAWMESKN